MRRPSRFITPCAPALRRAPPTGPEWVHEIKWDGWRLQAHKRDREIRLYSRQGRDITNRFPHVAEAIAALPRRSLILDGELVAFTEQGQPDFDLLRTKRSASVAFLFDILETNGADLRARTWADRRVFLERLMAKNRSNALHLSDTFDDAPSLLRSVGEHGLEGIVSKLLSAPYRSGLTDAWIKCKVAGWTETNRKRFRK